MKKLIFIISAALMFTVSSCDFPGFVSVHPTGEYITKQIQIGAFENVSVSGGLELVLTQDSVSSLNVKTYENIQKHIIVEVVGNTLRIYKEIGINFSSDADVKINLSCKALAEIETSGGSRVDMNNGWNGEKLYLSISGGGSAIGKVSLKSLELSMSGGSRSEIEGTVEYLTINSSGGSRHNHFALEAKKCRADMSGGASAELNVSESLEVYGSGGTRVRYKGNPQIIEHLSGGSSIHKVE